MPRRSVLHVHSILLQMIRQEFSLAALPKALPTTTKKDGILRERTHVWEVRHAGLLGIKYEVAVRSDLVRMNDAQGDSGPRNKAILKDVVDAAVLGCVPPPPPVALAYTLPDSATKMMTCVLLPHPACSP